MPRWARRRRSRAAFSLVEFLLLVLGLSISSTLLLPRLLEPRLRENEEAAQDLLAMLASSQRAWESVTQRRASLFVLAGMVADSDDVPLPRALMPAGFTIHQDLTVIRAGYRFRQARGPSGEQVGAWAFPKTPSYSGRRVFWVDFELGQVFEILEPGPVAEFSKAPPAPGAERKLVLG